MSSIVSSITGGITGNHGGSGLGYNADRAGVINPTTTAQTDQSYTDSQAALQQQLGFLQATQAQNGLGNQSQVFNQLQGVANGTGPNPAQAQLNQSTGANVAATNAAIAGARGSGANVGLATRNAANAGANIQQQAAGQAATLQANQSLGAINQMGSIATNQANQQANATAGYSGAAQSEQSQLLGAVQGVNNANVGAVGSQNSSNAGVSSAAASGQNNLIGNLAGGLGAAFLANGGVVSEAKAKFANGGSASATTPLQPANGPKSFVARYHSGDPSAVPGTPQLQGTAAAGNAIGKGTGMAIKAGYNNLFGSSSAAPSQAPPDQQWANYYGAPSADGGAGTDTEAAYNDAMGMSNASGNQTQGSVIPSANGNTDAFSPAVQAPAEGGLADLAEDAALVADGGLIQTAQKLAPLVATLMAHGGKVPALVSPGEVRIKAKDVPKVASGQKSPMSGEKIKGKPVVAGAKNSYANDTVPKTLNEGDIILPRSVTQSKNPHWAAHKFVQAIMAKQGLKPSLPKKSNK